MAPAFSSASDLITPIEPGRPGRRAAAVATASAATQAVYANAFRRLEAAVVSSCGSQHGVNEDAHSPLEGSARLFVVADGVGGGAMAQLASHLLVDALHASLEPQPIDGDRVAAAMLGADRTIAAAIARVTDRPGAATVVLCAPLDVFAARWLVGWVGDCRAYRWSQRRSDRIELLTSDDTFGHLGETPPPGGAAGDPARMVGNGATTGANAIVLGVEPGELLALCSDGVHKHLDDADWCRVITAALPLARRADALVTLARAHGSTDDATVLLLQRSDHGWRGPRGKPAGADPSPRRDGSKP
ncbi:MAG TPA: PP2C family serine/threonine-protein phosphatase [Caldimonas sp.]|nr:PP2C family serine/threonine-protein phosphatase [Caldimonas sp.]HEX4234831.1 PP2C family serine/threonine-protein phosphatase [Caldimonas sp.]